MEDLFDGWLVMPAMGDFLDGGAATLCSTSFEQRPDETIEPTTESALLMKDTPGSDRSLMSPNHLVPASTPTARQRRGHTKSRLGCITCKQRKIKCQETWPSCANCTKRGTICRYPDALKDRQRARFMSVPSPRPFTSLSDAPSIFSANDMQLFHHYLMSAYPCPPYDNEEIWKKDVPTYSHRYPYLMHAILGLAASHLDLQVEQSRPRLALSHRQKAISGLEEAFANWPPPAHEAHIMLATSYLLAFQSSYLEDGFLEHILALRGCASLAQLILANGMGGPFNRQTNVQTNTLNNMMEIRSRNNARLDQEIACEALSSISRFSPLVAASTATSIDKALVAQLVETIRPLLETKSQPPVVDEHLSNDVETPHTSPEKLPPGYLHHLTPASSANPVQAFDEIEWDTITTPPAPHTYPDRSFKAVMAPLLILANWPQDAVVHLFSPTNQLGNIIMAHFLAIRFIVSPLHALSSAMQTPVGGMIGWTAKIIAAIDEDEDQQWRQYVQWPRKVLRCLQACAETNRRLTFGHICHLVMHDPGALKEGRLGRMERF